MRDLSIEERKMSVHIKGASAKTDKQMVDIPV